MSGLVLVVGALMLAAGGYEMIAGNGDILSERGWSAFIAGAVLVAGGVVTMATGLAVRAVDRLRGVIAAFEPAGVVAERLEPTAPLAAVVAPAAQADLFHEPVPEPAATVPALASATDDARTLAHDSHVEPLVTEPPLGDAEPHHDELAPGEAEPPRVDWLDHSFAELEREMGTRPEPDERMAQAVHAEPVAAAAIAPHEAHEVHAEPVYEAPPAVVAHHEPPPDEVAPETEATHAVELEPAPAEDHPTVSAREAPSPSAVIGRYESEGTSYVMYADGSIDAQSAAGVYRFASMAELKAFIES